MHTRHFETLLVQIWNMKKSSLTQNKTSGGRLNGHLLYIVQAHCSTISAQNIFNIILYSCSFLCCTILNRVMMIFSYKHTPQLVHRSFLLWFYFSLSLALGWNKIFSYDDKTLWTYSAMYTIRIQYVNWMYWKMYIYTVFKMILKHIP